MIIKSLARKAPTFKQLTAYIEGSVDDAGSLIFSHNLYYAGTNAERIADEFQKNYKYLPPRKNGNALYHEIIVLLAQPHLPRKKQVQALMGLAQKYCHLRAPKQMVWGRMHFDTDYPHIHLMISANELRSNRRVRLERKAFADIQRQMERYAESEYPDLNHTRVYNQSQKSSPKITKDEGEYVRRTGKPSRKQNVADVVRQCIGQGKSQDELSALLKVEGFELYKRGKHWGVVETGTARRYRLKTLGLAAEFERALSGKTPEAQPLTDIDLAADDRAKALLEQRETLERMAKDQLDGFDHASDQGPER